VRESYSALPRRVCAGIEVTGSTAPSHLVVLHAIGRSAGRPAHSGRIVGNPEVITGTIYPHRNSVAVKQSTSAAVLRQPRDRRDPNERPPA
jgi:hypothetical protein